MGWSLNDSDFYSGNWTTDNPLTAGVVDVNAGDLIVVFASTNTDSTFPNAITGEDESFTLRTLRQAGTYVSLLVGYIINASANAANTITIGFNNSTGATKSVHIFVFTPTAGVVTLDDQGWWQESTDWEGSPWETDSANNTGIDTIAVAGLVGRASITFSNHEIPSGVAADGVLDTEFMGGMYRVLTATGSIEAEVDVDDSSRNCAEMLCFNIGSAEPSDYPQYEDNGGIGTGTGTYVDVPFPSTVNENDILLVCVLDADDDSFDVPTDWAKIDELTTNSNASFAWYWKRAVGDESGVERFTSLSTAGSLVAGVMARYSGCITSGTPYDVVGGPTRRGVTQSSTINLGGVSTQDIERLVVAMIGVEDNLGITKASDYTEDFEVATTVGGDGSFSFQSQEVATARIVPADTCATGSDYWGTLVLALIPAPSFTAYQRAVTGGFPSQDGVLSRQFTAPRFIEGDEGFAASVIRQLTLGRDIIGGVDSSGDVARGLTISRALTGIQSYAGEVYRIFTAPRSVTGLWSAAGESYRKFTSKRSTSGEI